MFPLTRVDEDWIEVRCNAISPVAKFHRIGHAHQTLLQDGGLFQLPVGHKK